MSTTVRDKVLKEKTSVLVGTWTPTRPSATSRASRLQQVRSMMAVPLQAEERVIGLVYVDSRSFVRSFDGNDLNLLTVLGNVAAIRIEHERLAEVEQAERLMERDLEQAAIIQRGLLPEAPPRLAFVVPGRATTPPAAPWEGTTTTSFPIPTAGWGWCWGTSPGRGSRPPS
jgi:GAF domain-containing protein